MPYSYTLSTVIPASPSEIYQAWLDSILHSEMTGGEANMSDEVGADVSAWDGYIVGRNLELVPGERIVQSWRTTEFDDAFEDSIITILLRETEEGTLLTLEHSNVPEAHRSYEEGGWQSNYFEPMIAYFTDLRGRALLEPEPQATVAPARDISTESAETAMSAPPRAGKSTARGGRRRKATRARDIGAESAETAMSAPPPAAKTAPRPSRRRKAAAGPQRRATSSARKAKPAVATKQKAGARAVKSGKKTSPAPAKRGARKASARTSAKSSAKATKKRNAGKAARARASRRKAAHGKRG